ncbi:hypothetical protein Tsubulata_013850 [Turnera subulata]|uniref:Uncharacterized protein n=1 Tax=Turnera subulata TaxID=218843 RepID=A0A9Q0JIE0_9ROSI|nr:hypothetical protein Tsubulata_013850 [Turnera subulata]
MVNKPWRIIPRPLLETVLNNHAQRHRVPQPLILHGPRGAGKTSLILERLLEGWNRGPHITGYVDFAQSIKDHHPDHHSSYPWSSWSTCDPPPLANCKTQLESCLESMAHKGIQLGSISSNQIFSTLNKWHRLDTALRGVILQNNPNVRRNAVAEKVSSAVLWDRAVFSLSARSNAQEIDEVLGGLRENGTKSLSMEEASYFREAIVALRLAKEIVKMQQGWRANAIAHLNRTGGFSRSLANSCTDWPCLLLELLSEAAEIDYFQPKLVINNIEVLKKAILTDDAASVSGAMYHDSLIWRIIALGANERCLPVMLVTSDSYYSYRAFIDFGFPDIFISRETFGWTPQEAKLHMVADYFSQSEWAVIVEVLGPNPRHLFELYALKQSSYYQKVLEDKASTFEDVIDGYLAYLQANLEHFVDCLVRLMDFALPALTGIQAIVTVVNPAMDKALALLQKFVDDAKSGKIPKDRLRFGAPWRHPPQNDDPTLCLTWAKVQLMDFVQSLVNVEFGVNYFADCSLEIFDDPCANALLEVGLIYAQRDPSFMRPISRGIERCLVRWLVQQRLEMSFQNLLRFWWQRIIRGRSYRHLLKQVGYK